MREHSVAAHYQSAARSATSNGSHSTGLNLVHACKFALVLDARAQDTQQRVALNEVAIGIAMPAMYTEIARHAVGAKLAQTDLRASYQDCVGRAPARC